MDTPRSVLATGPSRRCRLRVEKLGHKRFAIVERATRNVVEDNYLYYQDAWARIGTLLEIERLEAAQMPGSLGMP